MKAMRRSSRFSDHPGPLRLEELQKSGAHLERSGTLNITDPDERIECRIGSKTNGNVKSEIDWCIAVTYAQ